MQRAAGAVTLQGSSVVWVCIAGSGAEHLSSAYGRLHSASPAVHKAGVDPGIWETEKEYQKFKVIISLYSEVEASLGSKRRSSVPSTLPACRSLLQLPGCSEEQR